MKINRSGQAQPLTKAEFGKVLQSFTNGQHRLIFALCWYTTERPGAILKLRVEQVYRDPVKKQPLNVLVIPGRIRKDRATREVPVSTALAWELRNYQPPAAGPLFPGRAGEGLSFGAYQKALYVKFDELGMKGYSTYSTRRGALTELGRAGLSLRRIQAVSGHASLSSLSRYLDVSGAEVAESFALL